MDTARGGDLNLEKTKEEQIPFSQDAQDFKDKADCCELSAAALGGGDRQMSTVP